MHIRILAGLVFGILSGCGPSETDAMQGSVEPEVLATASSSLGSEIIIGRWCDKMIPSNPQYWAILEIASDGGRMVHRLAAPDGSKVESELQEVGGNLFRKVDSPSGDSYRIVPSDGALQLIDNDGLIRTATRLENIPQAGECAP